MFALGICIGVTLGMGILTVCRSLFFGAGKRVEAQRANELWTRAGEEHRGVLWVIAAHDDAA
jgi:hypothetical protein